MTLREATLSLNNQRTHIAQLREKGQLGNAAYAETEANYFEEQIALLPTDLP